MVFPSVLLGLALVGSSLTREINLEYDVNNALIAPDGFQRHGVLMDGRFPGPLIQAEKGDTLMINVYNDLTNNTMQLPTTVHWHGIQQHRQAQSDGTPQITQCPIVPQHSFLHDVPLGDQTGTFWYHSHQSTQYCDGLRGPLVIYDPEDPYRYMYDVDDESTIVTLSDWYHTPAKTLTNNFLHGINGTHTVPSVDSGLINGVGTYTGGPEMPFAVVNVVAGKRYRFRVINMSCRPGFNFSIDSHSLTVIEVDGNLHEPYEIDIFTIWPAQRYSVVVNANQPVANYWIRAPFVGLTPSPPNPQGILRYAGARAENPTTESNATNALIEADLHSLEPVVPRGFTADCNDPELMCITLNITQPADDPPYYAINGQVFQLPTTPVLLQILNGARNPADFLPSEQVFVLPRNKIIQISIPGGGGHPFHLHGHAFDVIQPSGSNVTNVWNPPTRDTVIVNGPNPTVFRFPTDNPGPWFLHCHNDWHLAAGMAVVMAERPADMVSGSQSDIISEEWRELCPIYANFNQSHPNS